MRKTLFSLAAILALFSCKDETIVVESGYATDKLVLKEETNCLLHFKSTLSQPATASFLGAQLVYDNMYPSGRVITTGSYESGDPLHTYFADSLNRRIGLSSQGIFFNGENALTLVPEDVDEALLSKPLLSIAHVGGENDTAWFTDIKMKMYRDTNASFIYINSYLISDFVARNDTAGLDLTMASFNDFVTNANGLSYYDRSYFDLDSVEVVKKGDVIIHKDVVLFGNPHFLQRGVNIAQEINPFGTEFNKGDVLGTESTPIRIYIQKPKDLDPDLEALIEPRFLSIAWTADLENGAWKILNVYQGK